MHVDLPRAAPGGLCLTLTSSRSSQAVEEKRIPETMIWPMFVTDHAMHNEWTCAIPLFGTEDASERIRGTLSEV